MFDELQINPNDLLYYIAELYIRNMKSVETIALLKEQLKQIDQYKVDVERWRQERENAVKMANYYEEEIYKLNKRIKELEEANANSICTNQNKKRTKK